MRRQKRAGSRDAGEREDAREGRERSRARRKRKTRVREATRFAPTGGEMGNMHISLYVAGVVREKLRLIKQSYLTPAIQLRYDNKI